MPNTNRLASSFLAFSFALAAAVGCGSEEPVSDPASGGDAGAPRETLGGSAGIGQSTGGSSNGSGGDMAGAAGAVRGVGGDTPSTGGVDQGTGGDAPGTGGDTPGTGGVVHGTGGDPGTGGAAGGPGSGEFGFDIRLPETHTLYCSGYDPPLEKVVPDSDWLCSFDHGGTAAVIYVQATAISCDFRYSINTQFDTQAWISIDGQVSELPGAHYDWGSFHHIDYLTFEWAGRLYEYGHSSLTDHRICHPMDCMTVFDAASDTLLEDGCTAERTLPVSCVLIQLDGSHQDLTDHFTSCEDKASDPAFWCERSGGTVGTTVCCSSYDDFPGTCGSSLSCTCDTAGSRDVATCTCPPDTCFNTRECVLDLNG